MHRATPLMSSFRAFSAGGARSVIHAVDDLKQMQEMAGGIMRGEQRKGVEAPQNYGFSSVVMDAEKDAAGKITGSAEGFMQFCGGNRSFPVCGIMDDRRHRLKELEKGDVAMFRTKDDQQQFHLTGDGGFWSAPNNKTVRMQLVEKKQQQQQAGGKDASGGNGGASGGQQSGAKEMGQKAVYKDGKENSVMYVDVTKDKTTASGAEVHLKLDDKNTYVHCTKGKEVYVGGESGKHTFGKIMTDQGPADNSYARVSAASAAEWAKRRSNEPSLPKAIAAIAVALILGMSLGLNYRLWPTATMAACGAMFASR